MDDTPGVRLQLLRGFALTIGQERVPLVWSSQRLLALLALHRRPVGRMYAAEMLWPRATGPKAGANLRTALWRAQRLCSHLVGTSSQQLFLMPDVVVDVHRAEAAARRLLDDDAAFDKGVSAPVRADLSADLLPEWCDDWIVLEREQYHQLRLHALEAMCARLTSIGCYGAAVDAGLAAVRADPLRESAHRVVIAAHLAAGNRSEAIRQYDRCRRVLLGELGLEPSDSLRGLMPSARVAAGPRVLAMPRTG
jgi:DNA-binding SARP family transcriptional activator